MFCYEQKEPYYFYERELEKQKEDLSKRLDPFIGKGLGGALAEVLLFAYLEQVPEAIYLVEKLELSDLDLATVNIDYFTEKYNKIEEERCCDYYD